MATNANRFLERFIFLIVSLFVLQMVFAPGLLAAKGVVEYMAEELLIQSKAGVSSEEVKAIVRGQSGKSMDEIGALRVKRIRVLAHALEKVKAALEKNPKMEFVEFNYIAVSAYTPDAPYYSTDAPYYPAAYNNVVVVSATTQSDTLASFSNYGHWIDLSAPGYYIYTTKNGWWSRLDALYFDFAI